MSILSLKISEIKNRLTSMGVDELATVLDDCGFKLRGEGITGQDRLAYLDLFRDLNFEIHRRDQTENSGLKGYIVRPDLQGRVDLMDDSQLAEALGASRAKIFRGEIPYHSAEYKAEYEALTAYGLESARRREAASAEVDANRQSSVARDVGLESATIERDLAN
jgi:hypothetical protein